MSGNDKMISNKHDPRLKNEIELTQTFACGETVLDEILNDLIPDKKANLSQQSWIITGPRGAGKSHLMTLLYRKIQSDKLLKQHWIPLIFPEELFNVDSLYRLLIAILDNLFKNMTTTDVGTLHTDYAKIKKIRLKGDLKQKKQQRQDLAKQLLDVLQQLKKLHHLRLILMLENLQDLLRNQITDDEQKILRMFLNENPDVLIIIGSALTVFNEIENYGKPFFHFFRIRDLSPLTRQGIMQFLEKLANYRGDKNVCLRIQNNRHYIYTYNILTGGNPRLILFLYELLADHDELSTQVILDKIPELTPYFLDKTLKESAQRKLILDALASGAPAQTATEIADYSNEEQKSISEQLKRLAADGWIREIPLQARDIKQKEVFYTLRDYFYRIWYKVRMGDVNEQDVYCMAELVTFLFDKAEIESRMKKHQGCTGLNGMIYEKAYQMLSDVSYKNTINVFIEASKEQEHTEIKELDKAIEESIKKQNWQQMIVECTRLLDFTSEKHRAYFGIGLACNMLNEHQNAINYYKQSIEIKQDYNVVWFNMGNSFAELNEYQDAIECYQRAVEIKQDYYDAWNNMGIIFTELNEGQKAIECLQHVVTIKQDDHRAWRIIAILHSKLNENLNAYSSYIQFIQAAPEFELVDFQIFKVIPIDVIKSIFTSSQELQTLLNHKTTVEKNSPRLGIL